MKREDGSVHLLIEDDGVGILRNAQSRPADFRHGGDA